MWEGCWFTLKGGSLNHGRGGVARGTSGFMLLYVVFIDVFVSMYCLCPSRTTLEISVLSNAFKCYPLALLYLDTPWSCLIVLSNSQ